MKNYDRINALPPKDIERKKAHIVGGGIAGFSTAVFLIDDAHMPAENITIYESEELSGGCLDAISVGKTGYRNRGSRMWERRYECLYYLMEKIPSIYTPGRTVLDETYQANVDNPFYARLRLMHRKGKKYSPTGPLMSAADGQKLLALLLSPEDKLEGLSVAQWFSRVLQFGLLVLLGLHIRIGAPTFPDRVPALPQPLRDVHRQADVRADHAHSRQVQRL